jgi:hypothetical protein
VVQCLPPEARRRGSSDKKWRERKMRRTAAMASAPVLVATSALVLLDVRRETGKE